MKTLKSLVVVSLSTLLPLQSILATQLPSRPASFSLTIPSALGFISETHSSKTTDRPDIILIQDLHVNRSVQFAISGILKQLKKQGVMPDRVAVEGDTGPVDIGSMQRYPDARIRKETADYLVTQGEMPGAMHFAVTEGDGGLFGIETDAYYQANLDMFRHSYQGRSALNREMDAMARALPTLKKNDSTRAQASLLERDMNAIRRLINTNVIPDELPATLREAAQAVNDMKVILPGQISQTVIEPLSAAVNFYTLALLRNEEMFKNMLALRSLGHQTTLIVVTGGFHTEALANLCKEKGLSYAVITPNIRRHDKTDENLYLSRLLDQHLTPEQVATGQDWAAMRMILPLFRNTVGVLFSIGAQSFSSRRARPWSSRVATLGAEVTALTICGALVCGSVQTSPSAIMDKMNDTKDQQSALSPLGVQLPPTSTADGHGVLHWIAQSFSTTLQAAGQTPQTSNPQQSQVLAQTYSSSERVPPRPEVGPSDPRQGHMLHFTGSYDLSNVSGIRFKFPSGWQNTPTDVYIRSSERSEDRGTYVEVDANGFVTVGGLSRFLASEALRSVTDIQLVVHADKVPESVQLETIPSLPGAAQGVTVLSTTFDRQRSSPGQRGSATFLARPRGTSQFRMSNSQHIRVVVPISLVGSTIYVQLQRGAIPGTSYASRGEVTWDGVNASLTIPLAELRFIRTNAVTAQDLDSVIGIIVETPLVDDHPTAPIRVEALRDSESQAAGQTTPAPTQSRTSDPLTSQESPSAEEIARFPSMQPNYVKGIASWKKQEVRDFLNLLDDREFQNPVRSRAEREHYVSPLWSDPKIVQKLLGKIKNYKRDHDAAQAAATLVAEFPSDKLHLFAEALAEMSTFALPPSNIPPRRSAELFSPAPKAAGQMAPQSSNPQPILFEVGPDGVLRPTALAAELAQGASPALEMADLKVLTALVSGLNLYIELGMLDLVATSKDAIGSQVVVILSRNIAALDNWKGPALPWPAIEEYLHQHDKDLLKTLQDHRANPSDYTREFAQLKVYAEWLRNYETDLRADSSDPKTRGMIVLMEWTIAAEVARLLRRDITALDNWAEPALPWTAIENNFNQEDKNLLQKLQEHRQRRTEPKGQVKIGTPNNLSVGRLGRAMASASGTVAAVLVVLGMTSGPVSAAELPASVATGPVVHHVSNTLQLSGVLELARQSVNFLFDAMSTWAHNVLIQIAHTDRLIDILKHSHFQVDYTAAALIGLAAAASIYISNRDVRRRDQEKTSRLATLIAA